MTEDEADPLAAALLPVLLHRLGNATQLLTGMNAMLGVEGGEELFARRAGDLAECSARVHELGWALAVLGSGVGADLLLERREPRGLAILIELVGDACRRSGAARVEAPRELPRLTPRALNGWELPWVVAALVQAAAREARGPRLEWDLTEAEDGSWRLSVAGGPALGARAEELVGLLPGAGWSQAEGRGELRLPAEWLRAPGA